MTPNEYLSKILDQQTLAEDGSELKRLRERRQEVEDLLRSEFGSSPTIRYGGSKAKGTMIKEAYDLDVICYFQRDDDDAGGTLETIYNNVKRALAKKYVVLTKTSAIRLQSRDHEDFHVDVVPGRFVNTETSNAYLHQTTPGKKRLQTNLDVHLAHVKDSGLQRAIRLMKLWRVRRGLSIKHFALELLVIKVLKSKKAASLDSQLDSIWKVLRDSLDSITIEDPANPIGNDLSELLSATVRHELSTAASETLDSIEHAGWEAVFGKLASESEKRAAVAEAARSVVAPSRPWCRR
jgi:hypothetical protein